jgi:hypothetical protein
VIVPAMKSGSGYREPASGPGLASVALVGPVGSVGVMTAVDGVTRGCPERPDSPDPAVSRANGFLSELSDTTAPPRHGVGEGRS